ncbi:hypothetical protein PCE1_001688 [Barthelona sp. PCE]
MSKDPQPVFHKTPKAHLEQHINVEYTQDMMVSVSKPPTHLLPQPSQKHWVPDEECELCTLCGARFSFFHRRHHCRRDGRVICSDCCQKDVYVDSEYLGRLCTLCMSLLESGRNIGVYLTYSHFITGKDPVLRMEVLRGLRNTLQLEKNRNVLLEQRRDLISTLVDMLDQSNIPDVQNPAIYGMEDTEGIQSMVLGALVNLSATVTDSTLKAMADSGCVTALRKLLNHPDNGVIVELTIWCLRNLSRLPEVAVHLESALDVIIGLLDERAASIKEYVLSTLANIVTHTNNPLPLYEKIKLPDFLQHLIGIMESSPHGMTIPAAARIVHFLATHGSAVELFQRNILRICASLLRSPGHITIIHVTRALSALIKDDTVYNTFKDEYSLSIEQIGKYVSSRASRVCTCMLDFFVDNIHRPAILKHVITKLSAEKLAALRRSSEAKLTLEVNTLIETLTTKIDSVEDEEMVRDIQRFINDIEERSVS